MFLANCSPVVPARIHAFIMDMEVVSRWTVRTNAQRGWHAHVHEHSNSKRYVKIIYLIIHMYLNFYFYSKNSEVNAKTQKERGF